MTTSRELDLEQPVLLGPDSLSWDIAGQYLYAAGISSAFVLQVMHPSVGAVVDRWSVYRTDPWGRAERSFTSVQTWIYGGPTALEEGDRLRTMHRTLEATDDHGRQFHALSAEPWAWVPLTGFHAAQVWSRWFAPKPLSDDESARMYQEVLQICRILHVSERLLPPTVEAYQRYFDDMIENTLEDHPTAHNAIAAFSNPLPPPFVPGPLRPLWRPAGGSLGKLNHLIAVGTLPPAARDKLGLSWTDQQETMLRATCRVLGELNSRLPERLRYMPIAYHARQAARARQRLEDTLAARPL